MKYQLKGLHLNQSIFRIATFQNSIKEARTVTCWHFAWHKNEKRKKKKKVVCAVQSWYESHWGLWMCVRRKREHKQDEFGVPRAATRTWTWWGKRWQTQEVAFLSYSASPWTESRRVKLVTIPQNPQEREIRRGISFLVSVDQQWAARLGGELLSLRAWSCHRGGAWGPWAVTGHGEGPKLLWAM